MILAPETIQDTEKRIIAIEKLAEKCRIDRSVADKSYREYMKERQQLQEHLLTQLKNGQKQK